MIPSPLRLALAGVCLLAALPALAALPPYYQRQAEFEAILADGAVEEALKSAPIEAIELTDDDEYRVYGGDCTVMVRIVDKPQAEGAEAVVGPRQFTVEVGEIDCGE